MKYSLVEAANVLQRLHPTVPPPLLRPPPLLPLNKLHPQRFHPRPHQPPEYQVARRDARVLGKHLVRGFDVVVVGDVIMVHLLLDGRQQVGGDLVLLLLLPGSFLLGSGFVVFVVLRPIRKLHFPTGFVTVGCALRRADVVFDVCLDF